MATAGSRFRVRGVPFVALGDIDLGASIEVTVVLDRDPGCDVRATGPVGRAGLQVVAAVRTAPALFRLGLPEEGTWHVHALCGADERPLSPALVFITRANAGQEIRLLLR